MLSIKDSSNVTRTVDTTNVAIKLNGNALNANALKLFKFVANDAIKVTGTASATAIVATQIDVTRAFVNVICPTIDICIPGENAAQTTVDYANLGVICPPGWTCIPKGNAGTIGVPLREKLDELEYE